MKKLILGLFLLGGVVISSFCSAGAILYGEMRADETRTNTSYVSWDLGDGGCFWKHVAGGTIYWKVNGTEYSTTHGAWVYCGTGTVDVKTSSSSYGYKVFTGIKLVGPQGCPSQYTSLECQTEYSLIPISSVDHEYCESNNLCTLCDTPINTGDIQWSALFINTIQYPGGPIINLDLGDNLDYTYSTGTASVDITVGGYEIDEEYLNGVIDSQSYTPTKDDFTKVFSLFGSYGGLLVVCLFVILVFYFIKKLFK